MTWQANLQAHAEAALDPAAFGEPVTLPSGATVTGLFELTQAPPSPWPESGAPLRLSAQANPELFLAASIAAGLSLRDRLLIRGAGYLIVDLEPADGGLVRIPLLPDGNSQARPDPAARWQ
jgi:hypothetical protein